MHFTFRDGTKPASTRHRFYHRRAYFFNQLEISPPTTEKRRGRFGEEKKHVFENKRDDEEYEIGLEVVGEKHEDGERVERSFLPLTLLVRF
jgi:hypothetical protein